MSPEPEKAIKETWKTTIPQTDPKSVCVPHQKGTDTFVTLLLFQWLQSQSSFLFQKRTCVEAETRSPECPMDVSQPFTGSSPQEDQQQVMVPELIHIS